MIIRLVSGGVEGCGRGRVSGQTSPQEGGRDGDRCRVEVEGSERDTPTGPRLCVCVCVCVCMCDTQTLSHTNGHCTHHCQQCTTAVPLHELDALRQLPTETANKSPAK